MKQKTDKNSTSLGKTEIESINDQTKNFPTELTGFLSIPSNCLLHACPCMQGNTAKQRSNNEKNRNS